MGKYVEIVHMKNRKGFSINFRTFGFGAAILSKPRFRTLTNQIGNKKGYFIAIHRLMLGIGFEIKNIKSEVEQ